MSAERVVLIQPSQGELLQPKAYIPLGLAYIGAMLERANVSVGIVDMSDMLPSPGNIAEAVESFPEADWYGITMMSATREAVRCLVSALKDRGIGRVAVGGPEPNVTPDTVIREIKPGVVFCGEAELAFSQWVLGQRHREQNVQCTGIVQDLDVLPFPARHLFDYDHVVDVSGIHGQPEGVPATTVITSRGCPYSCSYCCKGHLMYQKHRYRNAENVRAELWCLQREYKIRHVRFVDDEFTLNAKRVLELCREIESLGITWICITRADTVTEEMLVAMAKAGCIEIHIGQESGSDRMLTQMHKQITVTESFGAIALIKAHGIKVKIYLIYDYPGETEEDRKLTVDFVRRSKPDKITLSRFTPLPGSRVYMSHGFALSGTRQVRRWFYPDEEDPGWVEYRERLMEAMGGTGEI